MALGVFAVVFNRFYLSPRAKTIGDPDSGVGPRGGGGIECYTSTQCKGRKDGKTMCKARKCVDPCNSVVSQCDPTVKYPYVMYKYDGAYDKGITNIRCVAVGSCNPNPSCTSKGVLNTSDVILTNSYCTERSVYNPCEGFGCTVGKVKFTEDNVKYVCEKLNWSCDGKTTGWVGYNQ